ncbi:conserved membrane protein of unknown function [Candidatus Hydrogenisulfobacillus filiaventi]|uniref:DUF202 domain-containing protein n=1 Tax=Candidatus Hydrogenisulfobacillus filiaventi TaxID=2707344 RepID=A0A6F8ZEC5_9FIRM|nr:DUF202 domain-containing protein [Bacillota bacterium]CAB1128105.1 conserved membrane protein of unknown function [Candidatus Hydrogenisulfobacillus filiaventi]
MAEGSGKSGGVRDLLANERTFLAWIRTAIGLMGFGFVVAKFNLFLYIRGLYTRRPTPGSGTLGLVLVGAGMGLLLLATWHYHQVRTGILSGDDRPAAHSPMAYLAAALLFAAGAALLIYLGRTRLP